MRARTRRFTCWAAATGLLVAGCATSKPVGRSFERPELRSLALGSLDVVVSVSGPPVASPPVLNVPTFAPPKWTSVLRAAEEDTASRDALVGALRRRLGAAGYQLRFLHGGAAPPVTAAAPVETSTTPMAAVPGGLRAATSSTAPASPAPPSPALVDEASLGAQASLRDILDASEADAVLVVRAVPVDAFYVFERDNQQPNVAGATVNDLSAAQGVVQERTELMSGRLLLGQAFLFDRRTGLRLWSQQLPGFPSDGRLEQGSPMLRFGFVNKPGERERMPQQKASEASAAFARAMFERFPDATPGGDGDAAARTRLAQLDAGEEMAKEGFLDEAHLTLGVDTSWSVETVGVDVTLDETPIDSLGTGALASSGVFRLTPKLGYQWPGGLSVAVGVPLGLAPNQFSRTYQLDNPDPNRADPDDVGGQVTVGRPVLGGLQLEVGYGWLMGTQLLLEARGGAFAELWALDAAPSGLVSATRLYRFGVLGGADLTYRVSESGPLYLRLGARGRLGGASAGPVLLGGDLLLGAGVFL